MIAADKDVGHGTLARLVGEVGLDRVAVLDLVELHDSHVRLGQVRVATERRLGLTAIWRREHRERGLLVSQLETAGVKQRLVPQEDVQGHQDLEKTTTFVDLIRSSVFCLTDIV